MPSEADVMKPGHALWDVFCDRLAGPDGCNWRTGEDGHDTWDCGGGHDKSKAFTILRGMGFSLRDICESLSFFDANGGHCDCEILLNVAQ